MDTTFAERYHRGPRGEGKIGEGTQAKKGMKPFKKVTDREPSWPKTDSHCREAISEARA